MIALHTQEDRNLMLEALRSGARDFLVQPVTATQLTSMLDVVGEVLREDSVGYAATQHIYSFLPAKAGVGTTTLALNAQRCLRRSGGAEGSADRLGFNLRDDPLPLEVAAESLDCGCTIARFGNGHHRVAPISHAS
ncbi:MAG: hypothetical protein WDO18_12805 [Acidobacteriota bacterium]